MTGLNFLPGIPEDHIRKRLELAGGKEIESGKLFSPQSSAALAIETFGYFIEDPAGFQAFPGLTEVGWPACRVDIEYSARFPWRGGRHPWLDALVATQTHWIGVESKRFEPYRDKKAVNLSDAYWRDVWGDNMKGYEALRDELKSKTIKYKFLDAAQLIKHAFGLRTDGIVRGKGKSVLVYIYIETPHTAPVKITPDMVSVHKAEIADFAARVFRDEVGFYALSYETWLKSYEGENANHARAVANKYGLQFK